MFPSVLAIYTVLNHKRYGDLYAYAVNSPNTDKTALNAATSTALTLTREICDKDSDTSWSVQFSMFPAVQRSLALMLAHSCSTYSPRPNTPELNMLGNRPKQTVKKLKAPKRKTDTRERKFYYDNQSHL